MSKKSLYISGGIYKNKKIQCPPRDIRPVMSVVRESLFQVLVNIVKKNNKSLNVHNVCTNMCVVDLFCGSALMALECVSRGALYAVAVESDFQKWRYIINNIKSVIENTVEYKHEADVVFLYKDKVERFLLRNTKQFDFIYCDPPFEYKYKQDLLKKIAQSKVLHNTSIVAVHVPTQEKMQNTYKGKHHILTSIDVRKIGGSALYFYESKPGG